MPYATMVMVLAVWLAGCSSMPGARETRSDGEVFGPAVSVRVCILRDDTLDSDTVKGVTAALEERFGRYGLRLTFPWVRDWRRPAFGHEGILRDVARRPLEAPCDRLLALVGRDVRDFLWGALLPEVLGAVETRTRTKGYVVAATGSLNQVLSFTPPHEAAAHEMLHMLGLDHDADPEELRRRIRQLKKAAVRNRDAGVDFFPAVGAGSTLYHTRQAVDARFRIPPQAICVAAADAGGCPDLKQ